MNTTNTDAAMEAMKTAQAAHAACFKYSYTHMRVMPVVDDATIAARFADMQKAERACRKALGAGR